MEPQACSQAILNLVTVLSRAMDMVSPMVMDHHRRTAWISANLAQRMGFESEQVNEVILSALLHDIGAFSLKERLDTLRFEFENPHYHACLGYNLLKDCALFYREAKIILTHHYWWRSENSCSTEGQTIPEASHLIHLADRAAILLNGSPGACCSVEEMLRIVSERKGTVFMPLAVEALYELARSELFRPETSSYDLDQQLRTKVDVRFLPMQPVDLLSVARVFARIIDCRSHFTATHSAGVAAVAEALAGYLGFSDSNCLTMKIAGYLHDLGKIAVPTELLEKPGILETGEYQRIQDHVVQTRQLLEGVPELGLGIRWASEHHERLNGSGYPEHSVGGEIAFGSRVVAMADTFAAITEDRPYREGVGRAKAMLILDSLTTEGYLDAEVLDVVHEHFDELNLIRMHAQATSLSDHISRMECTGEMVRNREN